MDKNSVTGILARYKSISREPVMLAKTSDRQQAIRHDIQQDMISGMTSRTDMTERKRLALSGRNSPQGLFHAHVSILVPVLGGAG